ncbi:phosphonate C-P lyase system protein PhnG, partial [Klebsiella aerogenes]|uniref:phosphonate C-P lyase system protein PhnG n=1 Tax=Klebsiella aerogenes TaxID=548 RepID=UPI00222F7DAE
MMATLSHAAAEEITRLWSEAGLPSEAELLRGPETGLVTVRGRIGGGGAPFNVGEATVTRATVRLPSGQVGH